MTGSRLDLTRPQILAFRRRAGALDERLPYEPDSLRRAAWAGLQDSMPRAALLSIHTRVEDTGPSAWEDPSLVQLWGPRFSVFVVAACDLAVFSLGLLPDDAKGRRRAEDTAARLNALLGGGRMPYGVAGDALGPNANSLRYAAATGTVLIRWEGARQPVVWTVPRPEADPGDARLELARRYLHVYGPGTAEAFGRWSGIGARYAAAAFDALGASLTPVRTPIGDAWILVQDESAFRAGPGPAAPARLLPSGDAFFLLQGADRELLVPDAGQRSALWTSRVWPGALLVGAEHADGLVRVDDGRDGGPSPLPRRHPRRPAAARPRPADRRALGRLNVGSVRGERSAHQLCPQRGRREPGLHGRGRRSRPGVRPWVPFSNIHMEWQNPLLNVGFERLGERLTLVHYDGREPGIRSADKVAGLTCRDVPGCPEGRARPLP